MVVNTEWTINGAAGPLRNLQIVTTWDKILDGACDAPGFQPFEYMTAGRYLGELVRPIVLQWLTEIAGVCEQELPEQMRRRNRLTTTFLATVVAPVDDAQSLVPVLKGELPAPEDSRWSWDAASAEVLMKASEAVQLRSTALIAAAIVGLLACAGELRLPAEQSHRHHADTNGVVASDRSAIEELVVAYTGSLITLYPGFKDETQVLIDQLVERERHRNKGKRVVLREASDGGIIGAGVLAGTVLESSST